MSGIFAQKPVAHWIEQLNKIGVPCTPVLAIDRVVEEEQVRARDMIVSVEHPAAGRIKLAGLPIKLSETPGAVVSAPPLLGEHTREVLARLGYERSFIDKLISDGTVGVPG